MKTKKVKEWIVGSAIGIMALPSVVMAQENLDATGNKIVSGMQSFAKGGAGKAIFGACLLFGIIGISHKSTRSYAIAALVVGVCLGAYSGLLDGLWGLFTGGK